MPSPLALYPLVVRWLQAMDVAPRSVALVALGQLVTALLAGQSLRPSALARALLSPHGVPARQRYKRVACCWERPWTHGSRPPGSPRGASARRWRWWSPTPRGRAPRG